MSRILWHSNAAWAPSGYGTQTATFTPRIRDLGHHIAISAFFGLHGAILRWNDIAVYPADELQSYDRLIPTWAEQEKADLVITLMDVWVMKAEKIAEKLPIPMASWVPIDHHPAPPKVIEFFKGSGSRPIAMSRFGETMLRDAGLDPLYVPHGIDTNAFQPRREAREETRKRMGIPADAFVAGMVANNQGNNPARKSFPEVIQAFAKFAAETDDAYLYLHTDMLGRKHGVPIGQLLAHENVPIERVRWTNPVALELASMGPAQMATMYSAFDVLVNPSYGEGFGIPIVEAQACGTPVLVTDGTAMTELCGAGWAVEAEPWYNTPQQAFYDRPSVSAIHRALGKAYASRGDMRMRQKAREFALAYDADLVTEKYWKPVLEELLAPRADLKAAA